MRRRASRTRREDVSTRWGRIRRRQCDAGGGRRGGGGFFHLHARSNFGAQPGPDDAAVARSFGLAHNFCPYYAAQRGAILGPDLETVRDAHGGADTRSFGSTDPTADAEAHARADGDSWQPHGCARVLADAATDADADTSTERYTDARAITPADA